MKPKTLETLSACLSILLLSPLASAAPLRIEPQSQASARRQADPAVLRQAFKALEEELMAALEDYTAALEVARAQGLPEEQYPQVPTKDFFPRFEDLALQDQPDALRWCLGTVNMLELEMDATNARKDAFYQRIVRVHPNSPWMKDIVRFMEDEGPPMGVGLDRILPLLDFVVLNSTTPAIRAQALLSKAHLCKKSKAPELEALVLPIMKELADKYPQTEEGKRGKSYLFNELELAVGKTAPDFTTQDVDGVEFKLSDYRGKVVVLDFWGFWCPPCVRALTHHKHMVARLEKEPFALIGINTDTNKESFKRTFAQEGLNWRNSWQGSKRGPLATAWGVSSYPFVLVLDAKGVIRYRNLKIEALSNAVDALLEEMKAPAGGKDPLPGPSEKAPGKTGG
ncbi:MAG: TlpA family protein disulfide reductase [Planctomycetota bacterium]